VAAPAITPHTYGTIQDAYRFFNAGLWGGTLPDLLITLQRRRGARGYFAPQRFRERRGEKMSGEETPGGARRIRSAHELALNPEAFGDCSDREIVSVLVHEMVHAWQQERGSPSRRGYHNRQWAAEMKRVGLHPSSTGMPDGKEVGQRMSHYIVDGGPFATLWRELEASGFALRWESTEPSRERQRARATQRASKTKYTCPRCGTNAWAKPRTRILCGRCSGRATLVHLLADGSLDTPVR
jgi:predicted SprT family Zn-dependent metalloprotease